MALIDRIKYDGPPDILVWKYPKENITLGGQLIVNESQEALFFKGGKALDLFEPGTHTLSTKNLPFLGKLVNLPFGGETPFAAEIFYVNRTSRLDYKWGTKTPIPVEDPKYKILISIGCFGQFGLRVNDSRTFVTQIVGTMPVWEGNAVLDYFRGAILTRVKDTVAKFLIQKNISVAMITAYIDEISRISEEQLRDEFQKYGIEMLKFFVSSITIPDEELKRIQQIDFEAREFERLGDVRYQAKRSFDVLEAAAANPGATGTLMAAGIGLGVGAQMAGAFGNMAQKAAQPASQPLLPVAPEPVCLKCQAKNQPGAKFCNQCAAELPSPGSCPSCGTKVVSDAKFCPQCGTKVMQMKTCSSCGAQVPEGSKFCVQCGHQHV